MAQGKIIVETAQLDAASAKVGELAGTYKGEYEKLYKLVEELQASWAGADNTAYTTQIEGDTENGMVIQYAYKNVYLNFNFYKDTGKIRVILIDGVKGLDDV